MIKEELIKIVKRQWSYLKADHDKWLPQWQLIYDYICRKNVDLQNLTPTNSKPRLLPQAFDTSAPEAAKTLRYGLTGYTCSETLQWIKIMTAVQEMMDLPGMREYLTKCEEHLYDVFAKSNFYEAIGEAVYECENIGTTVICIEESIDLDGIDFSVKDISEYVIDENRKGHIDTIGRRFVKPLYRACEEFELPEELLKDLESNPERSITFIHMVFPTSSREYQKAQITNTDFEYTSVYIIEGNNDWYHMGGYHTFPMPSWRWEKRANQRWGNGPGLDALTDVLMVNQMRKSLLRQVQKQVDPPMATIGKSRVPDMNPGARFKIDDKNDLPLVVQTMGNSFALGVEEIQMVQEQIKRQYHTDLFQLLEQGVVEQTAREVIERQGEKVAVLSAVQSGFTKFLDSTIDRVWDLERNANRLPEMPEELARAIDESGLGMPEIKVDYVGPLAQAQKKYHQTSGIKATLGIISTIAQTIKADIGDNYKVDEMARQMSQAEGLAADLVVDPKKVEKTRQVRGQINQQQQQANAQLSMAQVIAKSAKAPEPGSSGEMLMQSAQQAVQQQQAAQMAGQENG